MINKVSIIGLGLIGGSIAKGLKKSNPNIEIIAIDKNIKSLNRAIEENIINSFSLNIDSSIKMSDIVFICTPVKTINNIVTKVAKIVDKNCIITDTGSVKKVIYDNMLEGINFIGGHPMAGSELSNFESSKAHLFENAYYILTPDENTKQEDLKTLLEIIDSLHALPIVTDPITHDKITSTISHVPHIIASSLVNMTKSENDKNDLYSKLAAGGFKSITRIASSDSLMWHDISMENKETILENIELFISHLNSFKKALKNMDNKYIFDFFDNAKEFRNSISSNVTGLLPESHEIIVDVEDTPGIIGKIATLLGENDLNIKNININNSREFENGVLIVTLPDRGSLNKAQDILKKNNYIVLSR